MLGTCMVLTATVPGARFVLTEVEEIRVKFARKLGDVGKILDNNLPFVSKNHHMKTTISLTQKREISPLQPATRLCCTNPWCRRVTMPSAWNPW